MLEKYFCPMTPVHLNNLATHSHDVGKAKVLIQYLSGLSWTFSPDHASSDKYKRYSENKDTCLSPHPFSPFNLVLISTFS